jgi:ornithine cyclodeaminase
MTKIITIEDLKKLIEIHGMSQFILDLISYLKTDFSNWQTFFKIPRVAAQSDNGIIELMPIWNDANFSYKYVNGHPNNPQKNLLTVIAYGALSDMQTGYPIIISEMTLLTAIRTAATSALASSYLAKENVDTMAIIGTGSQSEFQLLAHMLVRTIKKVRYFDKDPHAMQRFEKNVKDANLELIKCLSAKEAIYQADLITTATAAAGHNCVIENEWINEGTHINAIGGDSPGKTELPIDLLKRAKIVVEYFPQTEHEGEIQLFKKEERAKKVSAELWELVTSVKKIKTHDRDITIFDSVGFALEDFSTLRLVKDLSLKYKIGTEISLVPNLKDPKDLSSLIGNIFTKKKT